MSEGTPKVGYMPPTCGPFRCDNCKHYQVKPDGSGCDDKEVIADLGKGKNGLAPADPGGCCNEFETKPAPKFDFGAFGLARKSRRK